MYNIFTEQWGKIRMGTGVGWQRGHHLTTSLTLWLLPPLLCGSKADEEHQLCAAIVEEEKEEEESASLLWLY